MATEKDILAYVKSLMQRDGLSDTELSKKLLTGRATVNNWWNRLGRIPDEWYQPLATVFHVNEEDIRTAGSGVVIIRHAGDRIRLLRKAQDLTSTEVASRLGIPLEQYEAIESTGQLPPTPVFLELVTVLRARNPHWLAQGDPVLRAPPPPPENSNGRKAKPREGGQR